MLRGKTWAKLQLLMQVMHNLHSEEIAAVVVVAAAAVDNDVAEGFDLRIPSLDLLQFDQKILRVKSTT